MPRICMQCHQSFTGQDAVGPASEPFEWTHRLDLDQDGKFSIYWKPEDHQIIVQLEVREDMTTNMYVPFN